MMPAADKSLETRVALLEQIADSLSDLVSDHEKRTRSLERVVFYALGAVGLGSFLLHLYEHTKP